MGVTVAVSRNVCAPPVACTGRWASQRSSSCRATSGMTPVASHGRSWFTSRSHSASCANTSVRSRKVRARKKLFLE